MAMAPPACAKCKSEIVNDADKFDCDACGMQYHLTCDTVKKGDVAARAKSQNLKLYCTRCMSVKLEIANAEKLSIIYKYVSKIDMQTQQQIAIQTEAADKLNSLVAETANVRDKIDELKTTVGSTPSGDDKTPNTYASIVRAAAKPTVMIKPKSGEQDASVTSDDITKQINGRDVSACGVRKLRDGGLVVRCETNAASMKMKSLIEEKFGDKYDVQLPNMLKPRVKIFRVDDVAENDLIDELKARNEWLAGSQIELKKVLTRKDAKYKDFDVVIEVDQNCFDMLMDAGRVNLGWRSCRVVHHVHLVRCFKCCGYGHIAEKCTNKLACSKCSGEHKTSECDKNTVQCINCKTMNDKFKTKLNTKHTAWSNSCEVLKKRTERFARNFAIKQK